MAKTKERNKARRMRAMGESIKDIARILDVSVSSVSIWCRDIKLNDLQIKRLDKKRKLQRKGEGSREK
jgi:DNA invertase Pin-like site-specific DNA recombinase